MIHKYKSFKESIDDEYDYQEENYDNDTPPYEEEETDAGMEHIVHLLSYTLKNKGIRNFEVDNFEDLNISITITTELRERLSEIAYIFEVISYLKSDIIPQYESDFYMYQNRGKNVLEFEFIL